MNFVSDQNFCFASLVAEMASRRSSDQLPKSVRATLLQLHVLACQFSNSIRASTQTKYTVMFLSFRTSLGKQHRPRSVEEQSDQSLHWLSFQPHLLDPLLCNKMVLLHF